MEQIQCMKVTFKDGCVYELTGPRGGEVFYVEGVVFTCPHGLEIKVGTEAADDMFIIGSISYPDGTVDRKE